MATIIGDATGPPAAPQPIKYTSSCTEDHRLSTEGKIVSKYCNTSITLGGVGPSTPLSHGGCKNLHVRPRVIRLWNISNVQSTFFLQSHNSAAIKETPPCACNYSHQTLFGGLRFIGTIMLIQGPLHMNYKLRNYSNSSFFFSKWKPILTTHLFINCRST